MHWLYQFGVGHPAVSGVDCLEGGGRPVAGVELFRKAGGVVERGGQVPNAPGVWPYRAHLWVFGFLIVAGRRTREL